MSDSRCLDCGGRVLKVDIRGELWPYRDESAIPVTRSFPIPRCSVCGESYLDGEISKHLGEVLEISYSEWRIEKQTEMIQVLVKEFDLRQGDIENLLGVSAGYLSKAQHQEKVLSPTTYRLLFLLARSPYSVAHELSKLDSRLAELAEHLDQVQHSALPV